MQDVARRFRNDRTHHIPNTPVEPDIVLCSCGHHEKRQPTDHREVLEEVVPDVVVVAESKLQCKQESSNCETGGANTRTHSDAVLMQCANPKVVEGKVTQHHGCRQPSCGVVGEEANRQH